MMGSGDYQTATKGEGGVGSRLGSGYKLPCG